jgi:diaminohydroxyphosphoribosylaminopyrimidine deaminase/5-amino-6-(5-phosphoribosylamino)uracil reductase
MASGESQWITGEPARADVHRLRAEAGAVLTSSATVLADDPALSVRLPEAGNWRQPDRIVLDSRARVPPGAKVWAPGARRFRLTQPSHAVDAQPDGVETLSVEADAAGRLSLSSLMPLLAGQGVNELLVECGPQLAGAFLQSGLVDELRLYLAPMLLGQDARALESLPGLERLDQKFGLRYTDVRQVGRDLRITAIPEIV